MLFELGLFMGSLERVRTFVVLPKDSDIKIPTDILGMTPLHFDSKVGTLAEDLLPVSRDLVDIISRIGAR